MERHDPLGGCGGDSPPPPLESPPAKPKRSRTQPLLLRELAEVTDETLAFLYGGPEQGPGDFERNLSRASELRRDFTAFCEQNPFYPNWRQAWTVFMAQTQTERQGKVGRLIQELADPALTASPPHTPPLEPYWSKWGKPPNPTAPIIRIDFAASVQSPVTAPRPRWQQRLRTPFR
jgi:hypothetical protein